MADTVGPQAMTAALAKIVSDFDQQFRMTLGRHCPPVGTPLPVTTEFARALFDRALKEIDILWFLGEAA